MIADELCALFQTFDLRETKEHERLKAELEGALEKYRGSLPDSVDVMDTGDECVDRDSGLFFLYNGELLGATMFGFQYEQRWHKCH